MRVLKFGGSSVKDAEEITSTSKQGTSLVQVSFDWGKDMEAAETDVRRKLEMVVLSTENTFQDVHHHRFVVDNQNPARQLRCVLPRVS